MPESTSIVCDFETCVACASSPFFSPFASSRGPPSRFKIRLTFVSLVSRLIVAVLLRSDILRVNWCVVWELEVVERFGNGDGDGDGDGDGEVSSRSYDSVAGVKNFFSVELRRGANIIPQQQSNMSDPKDIEMGDDAATNLSIENEAPEEDEPEKGLIRVVCSGYPVTTSPLRFLYEMVY